MHGVPGHADSKGFRVLYATTFYPFDAILAVELLILNLTPHDAGARHVDDGNRVSDSDAVLFGATQQVVCADAEFRRQNIKFSL